ncbi:hypothetical protein KBA27_04595, partial [bacterium]|nr:hypothetical protein [bacterium]
MGYDFGSLTNLTKLATSTDWSKITEKYDTDKNGSLDATEYNNLKNDMEAAGDSFGGKVTAFGSIDVDGKDGISESEMKLAIAKSQIEQIAGSYINTQATKLGAETTAFSNLKTFVNNLVQTYLADSNASDAETLVSKFQEAIEAGRTSGTLTGTNPEMTEMKNNTDAATKLKTLVANDNGYATDTTKAAIKEAGYNEAMYEALNGDYTLLTNMGCSESDLNTIKGLINSINMEIDSSTDYNNLCNKIKTII